MYLGNRHRMGPSTIDNMTYDKVASDGRDTITEPNDREKEKRIIKDKVSTEKQGEEEQEDEENWNILSFIDAVLLADDDSESNDCEKQTGTNHKNELISEPKNEQHGQYEGRKPKWWRQLSGRRGTKGQRQCIQRMTKRGYCISKIDHGTTLNFEQLFHTDTGSDTGPSTNVSVEIGFGNGDNLLQNAKNHPNVHFIGVEIHHPAIGNILRRIENDIFLWEEEQRKKNQETRVQNEYQSDNSNFPLYSNLRIHGGDGVKLLKAIPTSSLRSIIVTFPDPWPNNGHEKWRIIQLETISEMHRVLKKKRKKMMTMSTANQKQQELEQKEGGRFYLATDVKSFDEWTRQIFAHFNFSQNDEEESTMGGQSVVRWREIIPCPSRMEWLPVISKYEEKGLREGRSTLLQCWEAC